ncbi:MAG: ABC transporter substrate-binding protein [Bosea sp.]|uniref:ABC transporter substrate-binding protein n=1 Tax=Bosea sp. (in: a-proteobacteria) TaxID=1871050 RepID=UPI001AD35070|nr:ABC transporter substrate-binding protein [Bosea sp. (in: a-proteobacteria)]MBN9422631.1 ABC transporter substrate-binding protein [Accumulibacter sp.]MBN9454709.1 ABC transporter substrate-binding protein [Bosea sp. (in: a-proteobacteria)]
MTTKLSTFALSAALSLAAGAASAEDLRIGFGDPVSAIDPQLNNHAGDHSVSQHFWSRLVAQKTEGGVVPDIAASWKNLSPNTWEFKLRENAVWTDGKPVTAEDVAFSYERAQAVPGSVASFKGFLRNVAKVEIKDPHTLIITSRAPDPLLPINISSVYVVSKHVGQTATTDDYNSGKAMVTDGPYAFVSYTPGDRIEMKRNERFWGPKPEWEKVNYRYIANPAARTAALLSGDVDVIDKVSFSDIEKLEKNPKVKVWSYPGLRALIMQPSFNPNPSKFLTDKAGKPLDKNPLLDVRVRQALNIAINREAIADRVARGGVTVATQWMPAGSFGYDPDRSKIDVDPNKAKALLTEAGYPNGFKLTMHVPGERYPLAPETAQAIAQFWTRIGVETQVEVVPFSVYSGAANKNEYAMSMIGWGNGTGEGTYAMTAILATVDPAKGLGASNWGRYSNPKLDEALAKAGAEFDDARREAIIKDAVKVVMDDVGIMPLYHYKNIWASRPDLKVVPWHSDRTVAMQVSKAK